MKSIYIFSSNENINDSSFCNTVQKITALYCGNDTLSLVNCNSGAHLSEIFGEYSFDSHIFVSYKAYIEYEEYFEKLLKGYNICDILTDETELQRGLIAKKRNKTVVILPSTPVLSEKTICKAVCFNMPKSKKFYSYSTVTVTNRELPEVKSAIKNYIQSDDRIIAVKSGESIDVYVFSSGITQLEADDACRRAINELNSLFGDNVFADKLNNIASFVVETLIRKGIKIGTAESCTAGMLSSAITSIPNSSSIFEIGISSYSNRIKNAALGVSQNTLKTFGAVSPETAIEMAKGIRNLSDADIGLSVTGVAGPTQSENKPVGTVYISLVDAKSAWVIRFSFGDQPTRDAIRKKATFAALELLRRYLSCLPAELPGGTPHNAPYQLLTEHPTFSVGDAAFADDSDKKVDAVIDIFSTDSLINDYAPVDDYSSDTENVLSDEDNTFLTNDPGFENNQLYEGESFDDIESFTPEKKPRKPIVSVIACIIAAAILGCCGYVFYYFYGKISNDKIISEVRDAWNFTEEKDSAGKYTAFKPVNAISPDIAGWITIPYTQIDNPICKTDNNEFYKEHNFLNKKSRFGSLYFDSKNVITGENKSRNIIIYGNNSNDGSMFGSLKSYKTLDFIKTHSKLKVVLPDSFADYNIFSVMIVSENAQDNDNFVYNTFDFASEDAYKNWLENVKLRSLFTTNAVIPDDSSFVTLITDTSEFTGAKLVVVAFTSANYDATNYKNTISVNPSPKYPKIWYKNHGASDPFDKSSTAASTVTSTVTSTDEPVSSETSEIDTPSDTPPTSSRRTRSNVTPPSTPSDITSSGTQSETTSTDTSSDDTSSEDTSSEDTSSEDTSSEETTSEEN